ncbi:MAG: hypothetical protein ACTS73_09680 [Arsenophonus sp. NEOnobi-MAG3]
MNKEFITVDEFVEQLYGDINRLVVSGNIGQIIKMDPTTTYQISTTMCYHNCNKTLLNNPKLVVYQDQYRFKIWETVCEKTPSGKK